MLSTAELFLLCYTVALQLNGSISPYKCVCVHFFVHCTLLAASCTQLAARVDVQLSDHPGVATALQHPTSFASSGPDPPRISPTPRFSTHDWRGSLVCVFFNTQNRIFASETRLFLLRPPFGRCCLSDVHQRDFSFWPLVPEVPLLGRMDSCTTVVVVVVVVLVDVYDGVSATTPRSFLLGLIEKSCPRGTEDPGSGDGDGGGRWFCATYGTRVSISPARA